MGLVTTDGSTPVTRYNLQTVPRRPVSNFLLDSFVRPQFLHLQGCHGEAGTPSRNMGMFWGRVTVAPLRMTTAICSRFLHPATIGGALADFR